MTRRRANPIDAAVAVAIAAEGNVDRARAIVLGEAMRRVAAACGLEANTRRLSAGLAGVHVEPDASAVVREALNAQALMWNDPDVLGDWYEALRAAEPDRRARGRWFTPRAVARRVVDDVRAVRGDAAVHDVLDPAMGGGRFLIAAQRAWPEARMHGIDVDPWAVFVSRVALHLSGDRDLESLAARLICADTLVTEPGAHACDVIVGNPPWVAHAGRQTVALDEAYRTRVRAVYQSFSGFPTTHGMFVEWASKALRAGGVLGLLLPTQVADLRGYGPTRAALTTHAEVITPLDELGFAQFEGVVEPTIVLVARRSLVLKPSDAPWPMRERDGAQSERFSPQLFRELERLAALPRFPAEMFGEAGFQTAGELSRTHLGPHPNPDPRFSVALREGSDITPFRAGPPSRTMHHDLEAFARVRARFRPEIYPRVAVVIRQTARYPIAAVHDPPLAFRNSLLAAYTDDPHTLVALLNSTLLRTVHLASQRDGRQAVFPQLKIGHLRALPAPPANADLSQLAALAREAHTAETARHDAKERVRAVVSPLPFPRAASDSDPSVRERAWQSVLARYRGDGVAFKRVLDHALESLASAEARFARAIAAVDVAVFAAYGVDPSAFDAKP